MNRKLLSKAMGDIEDRFIAEAFQPMPKTAHLNTQRLFAVLVAAALILGLSVAAYAAGWFSPIFSDRLQHSPEMEERIQTLEAAEQYMNDRQPEPITVDLPAFDNSQITLSEQYYNGKSLLLGINLRGVVPGLTVGYEPSEDLRERMVDLAFYHMARGNDHLDALLAQGLDPLIYDGKLNNRTPYAKEYDLRNISAIEMDKMLYRELSGEEYEFAWKLLRETGHLCVVRNTVSISDHITTEDGIDLGPTRQENTEAPSDPVAEEGIYIEILELPDNVQNRDPLAFQVKIQNSRYYYYMELGGPAYYSHEPAGEVYVPFRIAKTDS